MNSLLLLGLTAFLVSVVVTPLFRDIFRKMGIVDWPDGQRKQHSQPVARMGGVTIVLAYTAAFGFLLFSPFKNEVIHSQQLPFVLKIAPAGLLMFATGLLDDLFTLSPWQKLIGQTFAATWAYWAGVRIMGIGGHWTVDWLSFPLTLLWLLACTNAFNFIDGIDGLAAGLGFFATVTMLLAALLQGNVYLALATVPLAGCLLGFLCYNFPPASVFLGDSGSLLIGFLLGCYGVIWGQKSATLLGMAAPLMALAVPILDVCLSVARRLIRRQHIFSGDRGHIHHRLLDRGLGPRGVALVLYGVTAIAAVFSLFQSVFNKDYSRLIIILFCAVAILGIRHLKYVEFTVARNILFGGEFATLLNARIFLDGFRRSVTAAKDIQERKKVVEEACRELGFTRVTLCLEDHFFDVPLADESGQGHYQIVVPLSGKDYIHLTRDFFSPVHPTVVTSFVDALRIHLRSEGPTRKENPERFETEPVQYAQTGRS